MITVVVNSCGYLRSSYHGIQFHAVYEWRNQFPPNLFAFIAYTGTDVPGIVTLPDEGFGEIHVVPFQVVDGQAEGVYGHFGSEGDSLNRDIKAWAGCGQLMLNYARKLADDAMPKQADYDGQDESGPLLDSSGREVRSLSGMGLV